MKTRHLNILVFPGGTEIGLEIWKALRFCKDISLFSVSSAVPNHAPFVFARHFVIPDIRTDGWLASLNEVIRTNSIDYVYPANSHIIDAILSAGEALSAPAIMSSPESCRIVRSKRKTYEFFRDVLPVPRIYENPEDISDYPVFVKPDNGYGAQGAEIIDDAVALAKRLARDPDLVVAEYLAGDEYTIDCFSTRSKGLLFCSGRVRRRIRMGTSMRGELVDNELNEEFTGYARRIIGKLPLVGGWFFQLKRDNSGNLKLLEIEPRIAGTMALNRVRGINFPLLSIYAQEGIDVGIMINRYDLIIDRALANRYRVNIEYSTVYVDLDDTLIVHGRVNDLLIQFLYQALNRGCRLVLLSKCLAECKEEVLKRWRISELFDEIIWLTEEQSKADFIRPKGAIFIEDSFSQRQEVHKRHGIPTFDSSMIEALIDERN